MKLYSNDDFCQVIDLAHGSNETQSRSSCAAFLSDEGTNLAKSQGESLWHGLPAHRLSTKPAPLGSNMICKSRAITWLCFFVSSFAIGQTTFSTRSYGVINTIYNSVQVLNDGYLTCGWTYDTIPNISRDILLTKFNLEGENIEEFHYGDSSFQSFTQENCFSALDNLYIQQASAFDGQPIDFARLIWYNNLGDTLKTRDYFSPYYIEENGNDYIRPLYSMLMPDSTIYFTAGIADPTTFNDVCIWHLDKYGNELWHYIYATEADPETCYAMIPWGGGGYWLRYIKVWVIYF